MDLTNDSFPKHPRCLDNEFRRAKRILIPWDNLTLTWEGRIYLLAKLEECELRDLEITQE